MKIKKRHYILICCDESKYNQIQMPGLHIILDENQDFIASRCLEFNTCFTVKVFDTIEKTISYAINAHIESALEEILIHLENNTLDSLYSRAISMNEDWEGFAQINRKQRIDKLKEQYKSFKESIQKEKKIEELKTQYIIKEEKVLDLAS